MKNHWNYLLLASLLLGHLILLSSQDTARGSPLETWVLSLVGPVVDGAVSTAESVTGLSENLRLAGSLRKENDVLRAELESMRRRLVELHGVEEELERLSEVSDYRGFDSGNLLVASVVYLDLGSWLHTLLIRTGTGRTRAHQPVVNEQGLVGRIIVPARGYAKVLLLTDRSASVSAMIRRTRRRGIVYGSGDKRLMLDNIPLLAEVEVGDDVVTAGIDGIFPRGLPIGRVVAVEPTQGLFHRIEVQPAVDLDLLDQVYVMNAEVIPDTIRKDLLDDDE